MTNGKTASTQIQDSSKPAPSPRSPAPREWHLKVPLSEKDVRQLRAGDVVYLTGCIFTARDGVFKYMIDEGHEPPIDIRDQFNVTTQSSPAGAEVSPGKYMVNSLQATAGFRYAQWMDRLFERHGVRAVLNKGGMSQEMYQTVFKKHGVVCLSTMPYGIGAIYGKAVKGVRDVYWKDLLGISEAMWLLECEELGPLLGRGRQRGQQLRRRTRRGSQRAAARNLQGAAGANSKAIRRSHGPDARADQVICGGTSSP